jgi:hypothetical protein
VTLLHGQSWERTTRDPSPAITGLPSRPGRTPGKREAQRPWQIPGAAGEAPAVFIYQLGEVVPAILSPAFSGEATAVFIYQLGEVAPAILSPAFSGEATAVFIYHLGASQAVTPKHPTFRVARHPTGAGIGKLPTTGFRPGWAKSELCTNGALTHPERSRPASVSHQGCRVPVHLPRTRFHYRKLSARYRLVSRVTAREPDTGCAARSRA